MKLNLCFFTTAFYFDKKCDWCKCDPVSEDFILMQDPDDDRTDCLPIFIACEKCGERKALEEQEYEKLIEYFEIKHFAAKEGLELLYQKEYDEAMKQKQDG